MIFNSIDFAWFLPLVFLVYWLALGKSLRAQNAWLLVASYVFYGWWDWRFLGLIAFSSAADFLIGSALGRTSAAGRRRALLALSLALNLGLLALFKYFNFFSASFAEAFSFFGGAFTPVTLDVVLPVGISFYTFQTLSYTIDVYRGQITAERDPVVFFAFVSFFPQLVAGPIERASNLLPQFRRPRVFSDAAASDGLRQMLWGLFKKMVVADNCAIVVNQIFGDYAAASGSTLALGAVLFAFQIYCDFSGYSDIAIGTARLLGFDLMRNFAFPYFSRDVAEFWRRWHISLSTWFRDYLYIPLGGSRVGKWLNLRNVFIIFVVSGFWHGANWTFIVWGGLHALYFVPLLLLKRNRKNLDDTAADRWLPTPGELLNMAATFVLVCVAWVFFRAPSVADAWGYLTGLADPSLFSLPLLSGKVKYSLLGIAVLVAVEWVQRRRQHGLELTGTRLPRAGRWGLYLALVFAIFYYGAKPQEFIYFQF